MPHRQKRKTTFNSTTNAIKINKFVAYLNSRKFMKFTMEINRKEISFLDNTGKLRDRTLHTEPNPSTVRNASLTVSSYRSDGSVATYQILRRVLGFSSFFHNWGYSSHFIEESYVKVRKSNTNNLLDLPKVQNDEKTSDDKSIMVTTHHPYDMMVYQIISSNCDILDNSQNTKVLHQKRVVKAHRSYLTF